MIARSYWNAGSKTPARRVPLVIVAIVGVSALIAACSNQSDSTAPTGSRSNSTAQRVQAWVSATGLDASIAQIRADAANVAKVERLGNPARSARTVRCSTSTPSAQTGTCRLRLSN